MENKFIKLSIESDGTQKGTIIKDEFGNIIDNVISVKWAASAEEGLIEAEIKLVQIPIKITNLKTENRSLRTKLPPIKNPNTRNDYAENNKEVNLTITKGNSSDYLEIEIIGSNKAIIDKYTLLQVAKLNIDNFTKTKYEQAN